jgi:hypothetical protein
VPDLGRELAFATVFFMCACQIMAKTGATALLAVTNMGWLVKYVLADHAVHFLYRVSRRDMIVYAPVPKAASYAIAPLQRIILKVLIDFTGP